MQLYENVTYEEESMAILDRQVRKLRSKSFLSLKVQWRGHLIEKAMWESESDMRNSYPHIFSPDTFLCPFEDERFF